MPKISVILPYFNAEKTLKRSVNSIINQSFIDFELILVNNNSTDKSFEIATEYAKKDNRIILLSEKKQSVVFATQKGFGQTKTNFIARADADDVWKPDKLKLQYKFLQENPGIDVVSCKVNFIGDANNDGMLSYVNDTNKLLTNDEIVLNRFSELQVINPTILFRKEVALKYGLYKEGDFPEDYEMFLRWIENGVKYHKLQEYLLDWHDSETRLTRTDKRYSFEAFYKVKSPYLFRYLKENNRFFPDIVVWGAGKRTKRRTKGIKKMGINIKHYIDVDENKINGEDVISFKNIPKPGQIFIVSFVNNKGIRKEIKDFLLSRNYVEGFDFIIA
ncbi:MAG: glycosyltransferase family 2 protein [Bacteroidales bacterium]|nr:glycosyltransferase family 2 protein [Bacteroidales bacterium]